MREICILRHAKGYPKDVEIAARVRALSLLATMG